MGLYVTDVIIMDPLLTSPPNLDAKELAEPLTKFLYHFTFGRPIRTRLFCWLVIPDFVLSHRQRA